MGRSVKRRDAVLAAFGAALVVACGNGGGKSPDGGGTDSGPTDLHPADSAALDADGAGADVLVGESVVLFQGGKTSHKIALQPGASPSEVQAAEELRSHILACTGVDMPVLTEQVDIEPALVTGWTRPSPG